MQYTGVNDLKRTEEFPNGQEVYENDITAGLMVSDGSKYIMSKCIVKFHKGQFLLVPLDNSADGNLSLVRHLKELLVIGNAYQNPELLNQ